MLSILLSQLTCQVDRHSLQPSKLKLSGMDSSDICQGGVLVFIHILTFPVQALPTHKALSRRRSTRSDRD